MIRPVNKKSQLWVKEKDTSLCIIEIFFKAIHILIGIDYGFFRYRNHKYKYLVVLATYLQSGCLIGVCLFFYKPRGSYADAGLTSSILQYLVVVALLLRLKNSTLCDFLKEVRNIDFKMRIDSAIYNSEFKLIIIIVALLVYRTIVLFFHCYCSSDLCIKPFWLYVILIFFYMSMILLLLTNTFLFHCIGCRLSQLFSQIKTSTKGYKQLMCLYKSLVELAEKYKAAFDIVMIASLLIVIPQIWGMIYFVVDLMKKGQITSYLQFEYVFVLESLTMVLAPPVTIGFLTSKAKEIKLVLHNKLLIENDNDKCKELEKFIRYIEARPMEFYIWELLPLNANLLGMVLHFCVTYLIVIIQFTHKAM